MENVLYNDSMSIPELFEESSYQRELLKLDRLSLAYEMACRKEELDIREAEIRCMQESGDIDLLESYYMEAAEENEEKKKNIFKRIWEQIQKFFKRIADFIRGSDKKEELEEAAEKDEDLTVDEEGFNFFNAVKSLLSKIKQFIQHPINFFKDGENSVFEKVMAILGLTAIAGSAVAVGTVGAKKLKAKEVNATADELANLADEASKKDEQSLLDTFKGKIPSCLKDVYSKVSNWLSEASKKLISFVGGKASDIKEKITHSKEKKRQQQWEHDHDTRSDEEKINATRERLEDKKPEKGLFGRKKDPYSMKNWKDGKKMTISDMKKSSDKKLRNLADELDGQVKRIMQDINKQGYKKDKHGNILGKEAKPNPVAIRDFNNLKNRYPQLDLSSFEDSVKRAQRIIDGRNNKYQKESVDFMESVNILDVADYIIENVAFSYDDIFMSDYE